MALIEFNHKFSSLTDSLEKLAYMLTNDEKEAQALLQLTFMRALKNRSLFVLGNDFKAWIFGTMQQIFSNKSYKKAAQTQEWDPDYYMISDFEDPDIPYTTKALGHDNEQLRDKFPIISKMHLEGLKYNEIAKALNITPGMVKNRMFFSRKALMDRLNE